LPMAKNKEVLVAAVLLAQQKGQHNSWHTLPLQMVLTLFGMSW